jgi:hypothetical protein
LVIIAHAHCARLRDLKFSRNTLRVRDVPSATRRRRVFRDTVSDTPSSS